MTVVFSDGLYPGRVRHGLALSDAAFDLVVPLLARAHPSWTPMHRYGVIGLPRGNALHLCTLLRSRRGRPNTSPRRLAIERNVTSALADWIEHLNRSGRRIGIHGY